MRTLLSLALAFATSTAYAGSVERTSALTTDGRTIDVQVNVAAYRMGKVPAVVIAPGAGYHMDLPILGELAHSAADQGIIAYRFNWNYFSKDPQNGEFSKDYDLEIKDMQAVVALAKADTRVDASRIFVVGKSLGSLVGYRVFQQDATLRSIVLATPLCTKRNDEAGRPLPAPINVGSTSYPSIYLLGRPVMFATSDADPACDTTMLQDFIRSSGLDIPVSIVKGDHGWDIANGTDEENRANRAAAIANIVGWIKGQVVRR